jgi:hypothetical protein
VPGSAHHAEAPRRNFTRPGWSPQRSAEASSRHRNVRQCFSRGHRRSIPPHTASGHHSAMRSRPAVSGSGVYFPCGAGSSVRRGPGCRRWLELPAELVTGGPPNDKNLPARAVREALGRSRGGLSTKLHLAADRRCRPVAGILTRASTATARSSSRCWRRSASPAAARADPAPGRAGRWPIRRTRRRPTAPTCASAGSPRSSRSRRTRRSTAPTAAARAAARLPSMPGATRSATPWSAASASSNSFTPSPPATANATICTRPLSTPHLSGYGYETPFPIYGI